VTDLAIADGGRTSGAAPAAPRARQRRGWAWLGLVPFFAFLTLFLVVPAVSVFSEALQGSDGGFGLATMHDAITGQNYTAFKFSVLLSFWSAVVGVVFGTFLAYAIATARRPRWLRTLATAFSGVAANLGGVPLAFMFIALLGRQGLLTKIFDGAFGFDLYGTSFALDSTIGIVTVYSYFNIPLMVLVTMPAIDGLQTSWREASANLGGTTFTYWRRVGLPVLAPAMLGGFLLIFANSFSAYATIQAMTQRSSFVPIRIAFFLRGDIATGQTQLAYALSAWMVIITAACMGLYWILRKRAERWR
jgi:putative spermidine/putrescine transport system permease protein